MKASRANITVDDIKRAQESIRKHTTHPSIVIVPEQWLIGYLSQGLGLTRDEAEMYVNLLTLSKVIHSNAAILDLNWHTEL
jgi:hypothetical protein